MDVYRQAADIVRIVREGNGTAKALCLRKEIQKKKQTYAVVCETLRHYELLEDVLAVSEFFKYYPQANKDFALCMAYDVVLGKGVNTQTDTTARAITQSASFLREAYWNVEKHHTIVPRDNYDKWDDHGDAAAEEPSADTANAKPRSKSLSQLPRYARVNTLRIDEERMVAILRSGGQKTEGATAAPPPASGNSNSNNNNGDSSSGNANTGEGAKRKSKKHKVLPGFTKDPIVPSLLVFPPGTDLHAHPSVRRGQLVLQDRASCLPACVLLGAVSVELDGGGRADKPLEYVIDACAAPGNKTTQLAALGAASGVKIMATERDARRAELLQRRVQSLGAGDAVNVVNMDFFDLSSDDRLATEGILLDPSCSASGVVTRVDVALVYHAGVKRARDAEAKGKQRAGDADADELEGNDVEPLGNVNPEDQSNEFSSNSERVAKLARLQRKLLAHSLLSFDNCRTVVYSTCSVHEEENEGVVREVLQDERVQARGWTLSNIMPHEWKTRGIRQPSDTLPLERTIRCDPAVDKTNGFYVARFDRKI